MKKRNNKSMEFIYKHFLVLLTISTTVWGNPGIENPENSTQNISAQKSTPWSKKTKAAAVLVPTAILACLIAQNTKKIKNIEEEVVEEYVQTPIAINSDGILSLLEDPQAHITHAQAYAPQTFSILSADQDEIATLYLDSKNKKRIEAFAQRVFYFRMYIHWYSYNAQDVPMDADRISFQQYTNNFDNFNGWRDPATWYTYVLSDIHQTKGEADTCSKEHCSECACKQLADFLYNNGLAYLPRIPKQCPLPVETRYYMASKHTSTIGKYAKSLIKEHIGNKHARMILERAQTFPDGVFELIFDFLTINSIKWVPVDRHYLAKHGYNKKEISSYLERCKKLDC